MTKSAELQAKLAELTALYGEYTSSEWGDYGIAYQFDAPTQRILVESDIYEYPLREVRTLEKLPPCDCTRYCTVPKGAICPRVAPRMD